MNEQQETGRIHINKTKYKLTYTQTIALGYIAIILIGAFILMLPVSSKSGQQTDIFGALFTATSATCVTGLVVYDTFTHWSIVGQLTILVLIQIGGIGFMTIITTFAIYFKRRIGLHERMLLMQASGALQLSGVVRLIKRVIIVAFSIELAGAVILSFRFVPQFGVLNGIYYAVFHSVSALCNAGFDLMGRYGQFSSMTAYVSDPIVSLTLIFLILIGGLGFIVWDDIIIHKWRIRNYELHSKLALTATFIITGFSWLLFFFIDYNTAFWDLNIPETVIASLFQSVSARTAGFNSVETTSLTEAGRLLSAILMFIGGSSGSTAGGIKTTTLMVLILGALASMRRSRHVTVFKRRIEGGIVREASAFATFYLLVVMIATLTLCVIEPYTLSEILFEVVSALGTCGLSIGITSTLSSASKVILMALMFIGRVGWLTLVFALAGRYHEPPTKRVAEKVLIG